MTPERESFVSRNATLLGQTFVRLPIESLLAFALAATFSIGVVVDDSQYMEVWARCALAGLLAFPLVFGASVASRVGRIGAAARYAASALAVTLSFVWVFTHPPDRFETHVAAYALLVLAAFSQLPLAVAVGQRAARRAADSSVEPPPPARAVWWFSAQFFERAVVLNVVLQCLFGGLAAAIAALDALFGLDLDADPYLHLASLVFIALYPSLVAGGIEDFVRPRAESGGLAKPVRWFVGYVFVPLIVLYVAIVYAYHVKWLVTAETPINVISPLILAAGGLGVCAAVFTESELRSGRAPGALAVVRWWPALWLPMAPMAAWALWARIAQYGVTEFRYVRLLGLVALVGIALDSLARTVRKREPALASTLVIVALVALGGAIGPLSATAVSLRSQTARLHAALDAAGARSDGRIVPDVVAADPAVSQEVVPLITYLCTRHGLPRCFAALGLERDDALLAGNPDRITGAYELLGALGLSEVPVAPFDAMLRVSINGSHGAPGAVPAGELYFVAAAPQVGGLEASHDDAAHVRVSVEGDDDRVVFTVPSGEQFTLDLGPWTARAQSTDPAYAQLYLPPSEASIALTPDARFVTQSIYYGVNTHSGRLVGTLDITGWLVVPPGPR